MIAKGYEMKLGRVLLTRVFPLVALVAIFATISMPSHAKRLGPSEVSEAGGGSLFEAVQFTNANYDTSFNGGVVKCSDAETGRELWSLQVYQVKSADKDMEGDMVDVFITSLKLNGDRLRVENENGDVFTVHVETREVEWTQKGDAKRFSRVVLPDGEPPASTPTEPTAPTDVPTTQPTSSGCTVITPGS